MTHPLVEEQEAPCLRLPEEELRLPEMRNRPVGVAFSATSAYNRSLLGHVC